MNADRRKEIARIMAEVQDLDAQLVALQEALEVVRDLEQDAFDNLPESLQDGDRGQRSQGALDELENALGVFDDFDADTLVSALESASE